jgi:large subunit ribosomal protein L25
LSDPAGAAVGNAGENVTMDLMKVAATLRTEAGKSAARRLRSTEQIPAVAYGEKTPAQSLAVSPKRLLDVLAAEHGRNTVIEIDVDNGENFTALLRDYQYHPVTRRLLHADFLKISLNLPVDVEVPFETFGKCKGVVAGGSLHVVYRRLPVRCLPEKIPVKISYDVTELELDGHVGAKDLPLPDGVSLRLAPNQTVLAVVSEKSQGEEEAPATAAGAAAAAPAAAAAAAPAADAKAAAKAPAAGKSGGKSDKKPSKGK